MTYTSLMTNPNIMTIMAMTNVFLDNGVFDNRRRVEKVRTIGMVIRVDFSYLFRFPHRVHLIQETGSRLRKLNRNKVFRLKIPKIEICSYLYESPKY